MASPTTSRSSTPARMSRRKFLSDAKKAGEVIDALQRAHITPSRQEPSFAFGHGLTPTGGVKPVRAAPVVWR